MCDNKLKKGSVLEAILTYLREQHAIEPEKYFSVNQISEALDIKKCSIQSALIRIKELQKVDFITKGTTSYWYRHKAKSNTDPLFSFGIAAGKGS